MLMTHKALGTPMSQAYIAPLSIIWVVDTIQLSQNQFNLHGPLLKMGLLVW